MALRSSGSMLPSPFSAVGHKKRSHACGGSPLLKVYLLVLDCTMKKAHTFLTVFSSFSCGMMGSRHVSFMTADHEEGRGGGTDYLSGPAHSLSQRRPVAPRDPCST